MIVIFKYDPYTVKQIVTESSRLHIIGIICESSLQIFVHTGAQVVQWVKLVIHVITDLG